MKKVSKNKIIQTIVNNSDKRTDKELAGELGITREWFNTLKNRYANDIYEATRHYLRKIAPRQVHNLQKNSDNGDTAAAKFLLEQCEKAEIMVTINELKAEVSKIKEIQAQQAEKAQLGLIRKAVNSDLGT